MKIPPRLHNLKNVDRLEDREVHNFIYSPEERQVGLRTSSWTLDIFVISQPNWLKFGLQAHFLKMFGHAKFQPSSICSFRFLLVNFSRHFQTFFLEERKDLSLFSFFLHLAKANVQLDIQNQRGKAMQEFDLISKKVNGILHPFQN